VHLNSVYILFPSPSLHFQELAKYLSRLTGCLVNTANIPGVIGEQVTLRIIITGILQAIYLLKAKR